MKKWFDSPKVLFAILQVVSVIAILGGVWLSVVGGILPAMGIVHTVTAIVNDVLWVLAWGSFMGMCGRLMRESTAFTTANSRTLRTIGLCVLGIGAVVCLRGLPGLLTDPDLFSIIEAIILPGTFLTIAMLAFILRRLLDHAMALEEAQADVV